MTFDEVLGQIQDLLQREQRVSYRATGAELWRPQYLALLAEAQEKARQVEEGLTVLTEARAVMSLSRLWQSRGKKAEAHRMLADIYGWFTEGFDTKDLQEAKALLEELTRTGV